jgi:hypothetical protein
LWHTLNCPDSKPEIGSVGGHYIASVFPDPANGNADAVADLSDGALRSVNDFWSNLGNAGLIDMCGAGPNDIDAVNDLLGIEKSHISKRQSLEISSGSMMNVLCDPALYFSSGFTQKKANVKGTIGHIFDLGSVGANGLAIDLGTTLGYTRVKKPFGLDPKTKVLQVWEDKSVNPAVLKHEVSELFNKKS